MAVESDIISRRTHLDIEHLDAIPVSRVQPESRHNDCPGGLKSGTPVADLMRFIYNQ